MGTNGYFPSLGRQTMSFLLLTDTHLLLIDAGTGVARMMNPRIRKLLTQYSHLNIVLSHYHLDHVVGLSYLPLAWPAGKITILAPDMPFVEASPKDALDTLLSPPLFSRPLASFPSSVEIIPMSRNKIEIDGFSLRVWAQEHPGGSVGIRIGDTLAYITDTKVKHTSKDHIRGVRLLLHEVWLTDEEAAQDREQCSMHSHMGGVAEFARGSGVEVIMPVHHHPLRTDSDVAAIANGIEDRSGIRTLVPREGEV